MNNKLFLLFTMAFLLIGLVSAGVEFVESEGGYGKYVIDTWVPDWLGGKGTSEIKLIQNTDQCLIDCSFTLEGVNEQPVNLIDDIKFVDKEGKDVKDNLKEITFYLGKYEEVEKINYSKPIYSTEEVCTEPNLNETNSSNFTQTCYYPVVDYETYNIDELVWTEYNGEKVGGYFQLKAEAKKEKISMDWIVEFRGKELSSWEWWNSDWYYKRQINLTADVGKFSYLYEINYSEGMNEDYSDIRFINNAEDTEFNYTIQKYNTTRAVVRVFSQGENSFYMYYGNPTATTTSSASDTHFNPVGLYYLDETSGSVIDSVGTNNGTNYGATTGVTGKIGTAYDFDGVNDEVIINLPSTISSPLSVSLWFYLDNLETTEKQILNLYGSSYNEISLTYGMNGKLLLYSIDGVGKSSYNQPTATPSQQTWYHAVIVMDGTTRKLYIDGIEVISSTGNGQNPTIQDIFLGDYCAGNREFDGKIDEVGIWSRALTTDEISQLYNYTAPTYTIGEEQIGKGFITIDYITPPTPENNSNLSVNYIPVEVEINYTNATLDNITYDFYKGGELNKSYFFTNETLFVNHTGCQCDNWAFNVTACYTEQISGTSNCTKTETRYLIIDSKPPVINITSPLTIYDYLYDNYTLDLNWSVDDEAGLDSCWYEYNGTNNYVTCNDNTTTFNYSINVNNLTFYANDTFGNVGSEFRSWNYMVLEDNVIYNEETTEGSYETFILELTKGSSIQIQSAILHYDGQNVSSQIFVDNNDIEIRANLLIPSVESDTNNTFYWTLNLVGGGVINTRNFTQQVNKILIGNCSTYSNSLINLLLKDEGTKNSINGTIQTNLRILNNLNYGLAYEFIGENINVNTVNLCSNINLTETDFLLNAEIRYFADNHSTEFYHIQRANLTDYPVNLSLFTLAEEDTTVFTVVYRNQKLIGVEGAIIQLQRKYVDEGIFEIVEAPLTSSESKAILHIDTDTNKYQIVVVKNGEVLGIFENLVFVCQSELTGECVLNLFETISAPELPTLTEMTDFTYSISTNDTSQEVQVLFSVPSGTPNEVQVVLVQNDILGSSTICNETLISSSGSIICDYNKSIQDSTLELKIYKSDNLIAQKGYVVSDNILEDFGGVNYIILIIFVISLAFMAISSPEWIIINAVIALLIGGLTWLVRGLDFVVGIGGLIWLVVAAIILISKISKQEDQ